jgi:hypothetical protein
MPFDHLPFELYINIFQHLTQPTLLQCRLVCRASYTCATNAAFGTITFSRKNEVRILKLLRYTDIGCKVKTLVFQRDVNQNGKWFSDSHLKQVYDALCHLRTIDLQGSNGVGFHLTFLRNMATSSRLKHIERVLVRRNPFDIGDPQHSTDLYLSLNLQLATSITHLELVEKDFSFFPDGSQISVLNYLKSFINLQSLSIKINCDKARNPPNNTINLNIVDVLCTCPQLKNLQVSSVYSCASPSISLIDDDLPKANVKSLHLALPELKPPYITYVSHHTTANLSYLHLQLSPDAKFDTWISGLEPTLLLAFTSRLRNIHHVIINTNAVLGCQEGKHMVTTPEYLEALLLKPACRFTEMIHHQGRFESCHLSLSYSYIDSKERTVIDMLGSQLYISIAIGIIGSRSYAQSERPDRLQCLETLHRVFGLKYCVRSIDLQCGNLPTVPSVERLLHVLCAQFDDLELARIYPSILVSDIPLSSYCLYPFNEKFEILIKSRYKLKQSLGARDPLVPANTIFHALFRDSLTYTQPVEALQEFVPNLQTIKFSLNFRPNQPFDLPFQHLHSLTFDLISHLKGFAFMEIEMKGYKALYYQWKLPAKANKKTEFERSSFKFMHSYKRWTSYKNYVVAIRCIRIDTIQLIYNYDGECFTSCIYPWRDRIEAISS